MPVSRVWSNEAAAAGHDPCYPPRLGPYFAAAPELTEVTAGTLGTTLGVQIPLGLSKSIVLDLFSDASTVGPFTLQAIDDAAAAGLPAQLTFAFDDPTGQNGDKRTLTISATQAVSSGYSTFHLKASPGGGAGSYTTVWVGVVAH